MVIKAIILIGGPNKGQRFRPLSFDSPKYMFPVGGQAIIAHLIESCLKIDELSEIILLGFYQQDENLSRTNLQQMVAKFLESPGVDSCHRQVPIRYLQEFTRMGTAGGLYHFRDQIRQGHPDRFIVINGDVCGDFDFKSMLRQHYEAGRESSERGHPDPLITVMATEADRQESLNYGCIVEDPQTHTVQHYVEKPSTFVSNLINCGTYICSLDLLNVLESTYHEREVSSKVPRSLSILNSGPDYSRDHHPDYLSIELDVLQISSLQTRCHLYRTNSWWCQMKTAAAAIYANRHYLRQAANKSGYQPPEAKCTIIGDVFIHPTAKVDPSAVIGPNVSIMEHCIIDQGVRLKESIILRGAFIKAHCLILYSIVGWNCNIGTWVRLEGAPSEPDPNRKFAKAQNPPLFNLDGKLNPSISVLGCNVKIPDGTVILNTIILPHKELSRSYRNEIVL